MNLRFLVTFCTLCICTISFGQDYKNNSESIKNIDLQIEEGTYEADRSFSADKLILKNNAPINSTAQNSKESLFSRNSEWNEIKAQILDNKQRIKNSNQLYTTRVMDTVFIDIPRSDNSQLSGW